MWTGSMPPPVSTPHRSQTAPATPSKRNSHEAYNQGACRLCHARLCHVRLQAHHGVCAKHPPDRRIHDRLHSGIQKKGTLPALYICPDDRHIERFCDMVDPLSVPVDSPVGRCHAPSRKHAGKAQKAAAAGVHACLRRTRFPVRNALCTRTGSPVRAEFPENDRVDHRGAAL